jgi:hypothetical protein
LQDFGIWTVLNLVRLFYGWANKYRSAFVLPRNIRVYIWNFKFVIVTKMRFHSMSVPNHQECDLNNLECIMRRFFVRIAPASLKNRSINALDHRMARITYADAVRNGLFLQWVILGGLLSLSDRLRSASKDLVSEVERGMID